MKLRVLVVIFAILAGIEIALWWRDARQARAPGSAFVDQPLLALPELDRAHRIVIREKPQAKVVSSEEGFEVSIIPDKDAPIRETILERRDGQHWVVANYFDLDVDANWLGQTMRDLSQGRLVRFVASDPKLMEDLNLDNAQVRLEDEKGQVIRQLDFGRKDGGNAYQFVRVDQREAFVARHETEIVGDPPAWIVNRVLRFEPAEIREVELIFADAHESPVKLTRAERGAPLLPVDASITTADKVGANIDKILGKLLLESVMLAVDRNAPAATAARQDIAARLRLTLFDGREYRIGYGVLPDNHGLADSEDYDYASTAFAFYECSDPQDLAVRYDQKAALLYNRGATVGRLPKNRAELAGPLPAPQSPAPQP